MARRVQPLASRGLDLVARDGLVGAPGVDVYFSAFFMILHVGVHGALCVWTAATMVFDSVYIEVLTPSRRYYHRW